MDISYCCGVLILGYFYAYYLPTSRAWDKVSEFEDEITRCSLDISSSANTLDYQSAKPPDTIL